MRNQSTSLLLDDTVAEIQVSYSPRITNDNRIKIIHAHTAEKLFRQVWNKDKMQLQESFKVMLLNRNNQLLGIVTISEGGIAHVQVDVKLLLGIVLKSAANHHNWILDYKKKYRKNVNSLTLKCSTTSS